MNNDGVKNTVSEPRSFGKSLSAWFVGGVVYPFNEGMPAMLLLTLLNAGVVSVGMVLNTIGHGEWLFSYTVGAFATSFVLAYAAMMIRGWLPRRLGNIWYGIVLGLMVVDATIDIVCYGFMGRPYDRVFMLLLAGTNPAETKEFFETYFHWEFIGYAAGLTVVCMAVVKGAKWLLARGWCARLRLTVSSLIVGLTISWAYLAFMRTDYDNTALGVAYKLSSLSLLVPEPEIVEADVAIEETMADHPTEIVVVIGESLSRDHCSTMGYSHPTQPRLQKLIDDNLLLAFDNVTAPHYVTVESFKRLMSTYWCKGDSSQWWNAPNLVGMGRKAGYHTVWLSNQNKAGAADNLVTRYADFCDEAHFTRDHLLRDDASFLLDEAILPILDSLQLKQPAGSQRLWFIHLYGNHFKYENRYSPEFAEFSPADYPELPTHQRKIVSQYDNSVLYNDYIVDRIIDRFAQRDCLVFYFPDHGEDIFRTDPNRAGHAKNNKESRAVAAEIPLYIYMSEMYQQRHPDTVAALRKNRSREFQTTNFIYAFMDLMGYAFADSTLRHPEWTFTGQ